MTLKKVRMALWALVVIFGLGASVLYGLQMAGVISFLGRPVGVFGGDFALQTTDGKSFTQDDLPGTPSLMFFGYTFCPDVCPTSLAESTGWREALGLSPDDLRIIFVTVDPERDTAESLGEYLSAFGSPVIGLRGTEEQTEIAKTVFGVVAEKVEDASSTEYLVDHTASIFMFGRDGTFEGTIAYGEARDTALGKIRRLVDQ